MMVAPETVGTATDAKQRTAGDYQKVVEHQLADIIKMIGETNEILRGLNND